MQTEQIETLKFGKHAKSRFIDPDILELKCPYSNREELLSLTNWDEIELHCASNGIDVTKEVYDFFVVGMMVFKNIGDLMIDAFKERTWMQNYMKTLDDISLLYLVTFGFHQVRYSANESLASIIDMQNKLLFKWIKAANIDMGTVHLDSMSLAYPSFMTGGWKDIQKFRLKVLNAVDLTDPLLLLKFYSQFDVSHFSDDQFFLKWLIERTKLKCKYNFKFIKVLTWLKQDLKNLQLYDMHMS